MAKYSEETTCEHREMVREQLIKFPLAPIQAIQKALGGKNALGVKLDKDYINRLIKEIRRERFTEAEKFNKRLLHISFSDENDLIRKKLWEIIESPFSTASERVSALREIRNTSAMFLDRIASANLYSPQGAEIDHTTNTSEEELKEKEREVVARIKESLAKIENLREEEQNSEITRNEGMKSPSPSNDV